ncbi:cellulose binding domain-containing protein [Micromonospora sp. NPDC047738]|uniref:cellulose binding domain-containing protein n=1 Tax=Micromonospora sp. NPDC047738 TaxID=3155741 RepID=UPI0033ED3C19
MTVGPSAITGWTVRWTFANGQTVSQTWNATISNSGAEYTARNVDYNGRLGAGATTSFGFLASWNGTNTAPTPDLHPELTHPAAGPAPPGPPGPPARPDAGPHRIGDVAVFPPPR